jgi:hypothetical protein
MTGDDTVRLTYAELAKARGVSLEAARRLVYRHKWAKQTGNDGRSHIAVPVEFLTVSPDVPADIPPVVAPDVTSDSVQVVSLDEALAAFADVTRNIARDVSQDMILTLREQLHTERDRADRAEARVQELTEQLTTEMIEHRQMVRLLTERIPVRRSWWRWRRS